MTKLMLPVVALMLIVSSCASTPKKFNRLSLGMTKAQIIEAIGDPDSTKAGDGVEVLEYELLEGEIVGHPVPYWAIVQDGKLIKYGRAGDFGTSVPTQRIQLDTTSH
jgi:hypothetical protein